MKGTMPKMPFMDGDTDYSKKHVCDGMSKRLDMTLRYAHLIPSRRYDLIKNIFCT